MYGMKGGPAKPRKKAGMSPMNKSMPKKKAPARRPGMTRDRNPMSRRPGRMR